MLIYDIPLNMRLSNKKKILDSTKLIVKLTTIEKYLHLFNIVKNVYLGTKKNNIKNTSY